MQHAVLIAPPELEPVTIDEVRDQAKIDHSDEDVYVERLIKAARQHVENRCGIAVMAQDWRLTLDSFYERGCKPILLPRPPLIDVILVRYVDPSGILQTVNIVDNSFARISDNGLLSCISPALNTSWPSIACVPGAVQVEYTAGYADAEDVPADLKHAIILLVAHWHKHREAVSLSSGSAMPIPLGFEDIVSRFAVPVGV